MSTTFPFGDLVYYRETPEITGVVVGSENDGWIDVVSIRRKDRWPNTSKPANWYCSKAVSRAVSIRHAVTGWMKTSNITIGNR